MVPSLAAVRISNTISSSFRLVTSFCFNSSFKSYCFLVIDHNGIIQEVTEKSAKYFQKGSKIQNFGKKLDTINEVKKLNF